MRQLARLHRGTGLKLFPDRLNNLHHWVLGEETFARGACEIRLPHARWRYSRDDGLGGS